jgi:hypothetical protein
VAARGGRVMLWARWWLGGGLGLLPKETNEWPRMLA